MKILHISSVPIEYPGGTEKVIWELAKRQAVNNQVTILQTNLYMPYKRSGVEKRDKVEIITCKNNLWLGGFGFSMEFANELKRIWKYYDIVHIHGHGRFTSTYALNFLNRRKPMIYSAQGFFHRKNIVKVIYDILFGRLLKNADICTALTELEVAHLTKKFSIPKEKIAILPGGIDLGKFKKPSLGDLNSFRKKHHLNKKTLLYVGRIHASKGLQQVIESIKSIDCKFLIVGKDAGYKNILIKEIKEQGTENRVIFAENLNDEEVVKAYYSSDAFVLFSEWEGFGIVVIEAMAAGIPVVVSDNGALPYLVKDNKNGYVSKSPEQLRTKIILALDKNKKVMKNAKLFSRQFSWDNLNKKCELLYEKATKK